MPDHKPHPDAVVRIDVSGNLPQIGKTAISAMIADQFRTMFPRLLIDVYTGEGDYPKIANELSKHGHYLDLHLEKLVIVDQNTPSTEMPELEVTPGAKMLSVGRQPTLKEKVLDILETVLSSSGIVNPEERGAILRIVDQDPRLIELSNKR